ncbi:J domain-containing protein [Hyphococcus formosus]|uniref:J domain-containing protein n=1 Tax=Hyphococcus formosus TaxID=3143534 RepID=UPI00398AA646
MSTFDSKARTFRHRNEINVQLRLTGDREPMAATIFASLGERASDLLNDQRAFIPIRLERGDTIIVAKSQIASILELPSEEQKPDTKSRNFDDKTNPQSEIRKSAKETGDPYSLLRVSPDAGLDEIRAAYKARIKAVHPDALASLCLDEDIEKAAVLATQKVNYAYRKILKERENTTARTV